MKSVRVASVQFEHTAGDKKANLARIASFVEQAVEQHVQIIAFPECCVTGYWFLRRLSHSQISELAESALEGPSAQRLLVLAKEHGMTIGAGLIEKGDDGRLYNSYIVAMPDGRLARHRKLHCFVSEHIACGSEFTVFDSPHGCRLGVLICYDNNIIENARIMALNGVEILMAPHQTGGCKTPSPHCMGVIEKKLWLNRHKDPESIEAEFKGPKGRAWLTTWLPARAHDNGFFLIFSNGVGVDDDEIRTGNAMIIDCYGRIIAETCKAGDDMVIAQLDASLLENCTGARWIKSRRPQLYTPIVTPTGREQDTRKTRF